MGEETLAMSQSSPSNTEVGITFAGAMTVLLERIEYMLMGNTMEVLSLKSKERLLEVMKSMGAHFLLAKNLMHSGGNMTERRLIEEIFLNSTYGILFD